MVLVFIYIYVLLVLFIFRFWGLQQNNCFRYHAKGCEVFCLLLVGRVSEVNSLEIDILGRNQFEQPRLV